jgi:hypothetical protein
VGQWHRDPAREYCGKAKAQRPDESVSWWNAHTLEDSRAHHFVPGEPESHSLPVFRYISFSDSVLKTRVVAVQGANVRKHSRRDRSSGRLAISRLSIEPPYCDSTLRSLIRRDIVEGLTLKSDAISV